MKMTLLEDNHPAAHYNYLISIQTGHRKNAGTTSNVRMFVRRQMMITHLCVTVCVVLDGERCFNLHSKLEIKAQNIWL